MAVAVDWTVQMSEPTAAIERLCRTTGPWLHLLDGAPADARQLGWLLAQHGVVTRLLRGHCMRTAFGLYDEVGAALQLPGDPVEDWDALTDLLAEMTWMPGNGHVLVAVSASLTLAADPDEFPAWCAAVTEVARRRAADVEVGVPSSFHVVLADDATGLATLRARLAGIEHDELTGWTPQEPSAVRGRGIRTSFVPGDARRSDMDRVALDALADRSEVVELRRAFERFRALSISDLPVYGAVINSFDRASDVTARLAEAVAAAGAQVLVLSDIDAARTTRQRDFFDASVSLSPADEEPAPPPSWSIPLPVAAPRPEPEPVLTTSAPDGVVDADTHFEIVAANLEWAFDPGDPAPDRVDEAVVLRLGEDPRVAGLWRCWCHDPRRERWIRVLLAVLAADDSAADEIRRVLVGALERVGAARCCVEVVAAEEVGEAHGWLQEQSVPLTGAPVVAPPPAPAPPPEPEPARRSAPAPVAEFEPGPTSPDEGGARLLQWVGSRSEVVGLVSAWSGGSLVYGLVLGSGAVDPDPLLDTATDVLRDTSARVVAFAPATGLDGDLLALYRNATRLWRRPSETLTSTGPARKTRAKPFTEIRVSDVTLDNGVTLVGLASNTEVDQGSREWTTLDDSVANWAAGAEHVIAALRAMDGGMPVYTIAVDARHDGEGVPDAVGRLAGAQGVDRCAVESFCPFRPISVFHQALFSGSLLLWKTEQRMTPEQTGSVTLPEAR